MFKDMDQWIEIRRRVLTRELSKRAARREYQIEWRTLQRILKHEEPAGYQLKEPRQKRKLAAFLPIIHEILQQDQQAPKRQRHTAQRIFDRLRDEHQCGQIVNTSRRLIYRLLGWNPWSGVFFRLIDRLHT